MLIEVSFEPQVPFTSLVHVPPPSHPCPAEERGFARERLAQRKRLHRPYPLLNLAGTVPCASLHGTNRTQTQKQEG